MPENVAGRVPDGRPALSVVVPAYNAEATLPACLAGLRGAGVDMSRVVVADDGSGDATPRIAEGQGARVVATGGRRGAAQARNLGVAATEGDVVVFVDADVRVAPDALDRIRAAFAADPSLAAVFGSYDDAPPAPGRVSRVRNLLHHHVHHEGAGPSASFWTGLGAVRRDAFDAVGGFAPDQRMMEDVRFGHDLWRAGFRTVLDPAIQGAHFKRWTIRSMTRTDLLDRAVPWSRMLLDLRPPRPPAALNVARTGKLSVAAVAASVLALGAATACAVAGWAGWAAVAAAVAACAVAAMAWTNRRFLALVRRAADARAAASAVGILWLHYLAAGLGFAWVLAERAVTRASAAAARPRGRRHARSGPPRPPRR